MKKPATNENDITDPVTDCRQLRKKKGWSQGDLAYYGRVSLGVIWRMENAEDDEALENTRVGSFLSVAEALSVKPTKLYPRLGELLR